MSLRNALDSKDEATISAPRDQQREQLLPAEAKEDPLQSTLDQLIILFNSLEDLENSPIKKTYNLLSNEELSKLNNFNVTLTQDYLAWLAKLRDFLPEDTISAHLIFTIVNNETTEVIATIPRNLFDQITTSGQLSMLRRFLPSDAFSPENLSLQLGPPKWIETYITSARNHLGEQKAAEEKKREEDKKIKEAKIREARLNVLTKKESKKTSELKTTLEKPLIEASTVKKTIHHIRQLGKQHPERKIESDEERRHRENRAKKFEDLSYNKKKFSKEKTKIQWVQAKQDLKATKSHDNSEILSTSSKKEITQSLTLNQNLITSLIHSYENDFSLFKSRRADKKNFLIQLRNAVHYKDLYSLIQNTHISAIEKGFFRHRVKDLLYEIQSKDPVLRDLIEMKLLIESLEQEKKFSLFSKTLKTKKIMFLTNALDAKVKNPEQSWITIFASVTKNDKDYEKGYFSRVRKLINKLSSTQQTERKFNLK